MSVRTWRSQRNSIKNGGISRGSTIPCLPKQMRPFFQSSIVTNYFFHLQNAANKQIIRVCWWLGVINNGQVCGLSTSSVKTLAKHSSIHLYPHRSYISIYILSQLKPNLGNKENKKKDLFLFYQFMNFVIKRLQEIKETIDIYIILYWLARKLRAYIAIFFLFLLLCVQFSVNAQLQDKFLRK